MAFIREIPIEASPGPIRKLYKDDLRTLGYVANSTKLFTLCPDVHASWLTLLESLRAQMSPRRYALVALAVEAQLRRSALKPESTISSGELSAHARDHHYDPLSAAEAAVMAFAARVTVRAHRIDRHAVDVLRAQGFLDSEILDIGLAASALCFWSTILETVGGEPDERSMSFDEGFRRALVTGRPTEVTAVKVKRPVPVRRKRRRARADYGPLRRKAIAASLGVVVLGGGLVMARVSRRAVLEHAATPKAAVIPSTRPAPTETATIPVPAPLALATTSRCSMTEARTWLDGSCWSLMKSGSEISTEAAIVPPAQPGAAPPTSIVPHQPAPKITDVPPRDPIPPNVNGDEPKGDAGERAWREFRQSVSPRHLGGAE